MTQLARKPPTCQKFHCNWLLKKTGNATTNQISRAPNKNKRAADKILIARLLENSSLNFGLFLALPKSCCNNNKLAIHTSANALAISHNAPLKLITASSAPPIKNPTPFNAFLDPVNNAIHLNN